MICIAGKYRAGPPIRPAGPPGRAGTTAIGGRLVADIDEVVIWITEPDPALGDPPRGSDLRHAGAPHGLAGLREGAARLIECVSGAT